MDLTKQIKKRIIEVNSTPSVRYYIIDGVLFNDLSFYV